jgi:hypothetical protein
MIAQWQRLSADAVPAALLNYQLNPQYPRPDPLPLALLPPRPRPAVPWIDLVADALGFFVGV